MLAAAIVVLHHLPLTRVFASRQCDVAAGDDGVVLWPGETAIELAMPLAASFVRFTALGHLAFPGRNGMQPLTVSAVRHHMRPEIPTVRVSGAGDR